MGIFAGGVLAVAVLWSAARWLRGSGRADNGVMSQQWLAEQRLSHPPDPQR